MHLKDYPLEYINVYDFYEVQRGLGEEINLQIRIFMTIRSLCILKKYEVSKIKLTTERLITQWKNRQKL